MVNDLVKRRGRPKKYADAHPDTQAQLIQAGLQWLTTSGFNQSSLDSILRSVHVPKGSFYHYFDSKEAFGLAVLQHYRHYFEAKLHRHFTNPHVVPIQRLAHFIADACQGMAKYDFTRGCLIGNLEQEIPQLSAAFRQAITETYYSWQQLLADCLAEAQTQGAIAQNSDVAYLAEIFWIGWEGAVSRARLLKSDLPLRRFGQFYLQQLNV